jgi:hypothetical protein
MFWMFVLRGFLGSNKCVMILFVSALLFNTLFSISKSLLGGSNSLSSSASQLVYSQSSSTAWVQGPYLIQYSVL